MRVLTAAEIRGLESCAVESGVSMETLMENAGAAVATAVTEKMDVTGKKTVILCGKGNNGGDGYALAILMEDSGVPVAVLESAKPKSRDCIYYASRCGSPPILQSRRMTKWAAALRSSCIARQAAR